MSKEGDEAEGEEAEGDEAEGEGEEYAEGEEGAGYAEGEEEYEANKPFQVFSCWNGMVAFAGVGRVIGKSSFT